MGSQIKRKLCAKCRRRRLTKFFSKKRGGFQSYCKDCQSKISKAHYRDNKATYNARRYQRQIKQRKLLRAVVEEAKQGSCLDCHETHPPWAMDFDHRPGTKKKFNVSDALRASVTVERLKAEIAKCDLICALCHRYRTHGQRRIVQH